MIISLILTIAIGRLFFSLAHDHDRSAWGFAILGGGVFLGSQLIFGVILGIVLALTGNMDLLTTTSGTLMISLVGLVISAVSCWILFALLKRSWIKNPKSKKRDDLID
ncbi:MAG: hypothetical protein HYZ43_10260 [Flavobacteriia bacterium]|nr:hypothetical protein [Flavobacteriia bacterium]